MNDSVDDFLYPTEFGAVLGVRERQVRKILGELVVLGFKLGVGRGGVRLCPRPLAAAVKAARERGKELSALRLDPSLEAFLARDARGVEPDGLDMLIFCAAEHAILRETLGALAETVRTALPNAGNRMANFKALGLPDPRNGL